MIPSVPTEVTEYTKAQIALLNDELFTLQHKIWERPEMAFEEKNTHKLLTKFMSKQKGWTVTKHAYGLETAFECVFTYQPDVCSTVISFNSEMDGLPELGHACGHNLIAIAGVTAAVATALAMQKFKIPGTVKLFGTPAEEGGGGKIKLLEAGCYDGVDVSLMAHPHDQHNAAYARDSAYERFEVEFFGKEAHAAAFPWQGINALDAMVLTYNNISVLRQQLMEKDIVQCQVEEGGKAANIIAGYTKGMFIVRAPTQARLNEVKEKVINCIKAGALATGCTYAITDLMNYKNMVCNKVLAKIYSTYMTEAMGMEMLPLDQDYETAYTGASTDQGNISYALPAAHVMFHVDCPKVGPHTKEFEKAAGTKQAHESALTAGVALSFTGLELLLNPARLKQVKRAFEKDMEQNSASDYKAMKDWMVVQ